MKCQHCGEEIEAKSLYCSKCGEPVEIVPEYNFLEEELLSELVADKDDKNSEFVEGVYFKENESKEDNKNKSETKPESKPSQKKPSLGVISVGFILGIIIVCTIAFYVASVIEKDRYTQSYDYYITQAQECQTKGDLDSALNYYLLALEKNTSNIDILIKCGEIHAKQNNIDMALEYYNKVLQLDITNQTAYEHIIEIYVSQGDYQKLADMAQDPPSTGIASLLEPYKVEAPAFSVDEGVYNDDIKVSIVSYGHNEIYYTMDGSDPIKYGRLYIQPLEIKVGETILKAVCCTDNMVYSPVSMNSYVIEYTVPDAPVVTPAGGTFYESTLISVSIPTGYYCYYTWDGSTPTTSSAMCNGHLDIPDGENVLSIMITDKHGMQSGVERYNFALYR